MCGICGIVNLSPDTPADIHVAKGMSETMSHRGPDGSGHFAQGPCALGHRRLSIIDIAGGAQPMTDNTGRGAATIVFNGEIYNFRDLRDKLIQKGRRFFSNCDTEVILKAYAQWGDRHVEHLRGMFAYAIWDPEKQRLFLARDRMGIKPLYYCHTDECFAFSSEITAFFTTGLAKARWEPAALDAYFTLGYVPGPLTLFKGVFKLPPGHGAVFSPDNGWEEFTYWDISPAPQAPSPSFEAACRDLDRLLNETVDMHLMSDVPLGVFLSGGLDSSLVTALAGRHSNRPVKTFSVGYENAPEANELAFARMAAKQLNTEHREFILEPKGFLGALPELVQRMEEPVVELAAIPLLRLSQLARPHATVLLSGEGADEVFGGYALYRRMLAMERLAFLRPLFHLLPGHRLPKERHMKYADWLSLPLAERYRGTSADLTASAKARFYGPALARLAKARPYLDRSFGEYFQKSGRWPALSRLLYVDSKTWLVDDLLVKADKMTMAASVELRVPFLDHKVVDFGARLPDEFKLNGKTGKHILKKVAENYLPRQIVHRTKQGFPLPVKRWMGGELYGDIRKLLLSDRVSDLGLFQPPYLRRLLRQHQTGAADHSRRIFSIMILVHWIQAFGIDPEMPRA